MLGADSDHDPALPRLSELGIKTYLGVPIVVSGRSIAVVEAVDIAQPDDLEIHASTLETAVAQLADRLATESQRDIWQGSDAPGNKLTDSTVLDLVLRPENESDEPIEITPAEWSILHGLDGERQLGAVAQAAGLSFTQAAALAESLLERGLARIGRENRRRV
jgi:hypothetical protein